MVTPEENDRILDELNDNKILEYSPAIAYSALVMVLGISGNIFSIAFYGFKSQRTTTNNLIAVLATTDLIACIVFCDEIIELCFTITFKNVFGCKIMYFTNHSLVLSSSFVLLLISVDRFQKICRRQAWQLTLTSAKLCTGALFFLAILLSVRDFVILDVVQVKLTDPERNETITGYYCTHSRNVKKKAAVTAFQLIDLATFLIVISTVTVLYTFVAREIWIQRKRKESHMHVTNPKASVPESETGGIDSPSDISVEETFTTCTSNNLSERADPNVSNSENKTDVNTLSNTYQEKKTQRISNESKPKQSKERHQSTLKKILTKSAKSHEENHARRKHSDAVERKIAVMMIVITAASVLSFVPYFIVNLAVKRNSNTPEQEFSVGMQIALRSFMLNNAVNPYIMGLFNTQFKIFVKESVCKCRQLRL